MPESSNPFTEIFNNSNEIQEERKKAISEYNKGNYDVAFRLFSKLSKNGDSESQFYLGLMYANGQGVEQSYEEAVKWYKMSADQGDASAQYNLGLMYENGQGVKKSLSKALELYTQSYDNKRTSGKDKIDLLESMIGLIGGTVENDLEKSSGYSTRPSPKTQSQASNDGKTSRPNNDSTNGFEAIFKRLTAEEFMEDPTRILSLMMDFGFDPRQVRLLRTVMTEDMKEVKDFLQSPMGSGYEIAEGIAEYCLVSEDALKDILDGIRSSLNGDIGTEIIDDDEFGRCRISLDGIAKYSLDMSVLLWVKEDISEFRIPDSVTEIGRFAFSSCTSLKEVHIPNSVRKIDGDIIFGAFSSCTSLKEVHIPDSVTEIGMYAFYGCTSLKEVHIPDSVTEIGDDAFEGCTSVHFIVDPNNKHFYSKSGELCRR